MQACLAGPISMDLSAPSFFPSGGEFYDLRLPPTRQDIRKYSWRALSIEAARRLAHAISARPPPYHLPSLIYPARQRVIEDKGELLWMEIAIEKIR